MSKLKTHLFSPPDVLGCNHIDEVIVIVPLCVCLCRVDVIEEVHSGNQKLREGHEGRAEAGAKR